MNGPERSGGLPVRVLLRPIGTPLTIGMAGLSIASLVHGGFDLGWVPKSQQADVGLILIAAPFLLQLLACVFAYLARDGAAGAALGVLSTLWLALGITEVHSSPGATASATGLLLLGAAAAVGLSALAMMGSKLLPATVFLLTAIRFALAGVYELSGTAAWQDAAGIASLVVLAGALYSVLAFELEDQQHRPVLPTLRRAKAKRAVEGGFSQQVDGLPHEAGVRQMT